MPPLLLNRGLYIQPFIKPKSIGPGSSSTSSSHFTSEPIVRLSSISTEMPDLHERVKTTNNNNYPSSNEFGVYITTKDAHTLNDGPTMFITNDIEKISQFYIIQSNIPSVVMDDIASKIDFNRNWLEGTDSTKSLLPIYNKYHDFIKETELNVKEPLLLIDIHGHKHSENLIELGYGFPISEKRNPELFDSKSFGHLLNKNYGSPVAYPPNKVKPLLYFDGGYITETKYKNNSIHIQVELPQNMRSKHKQRNIIAKILAKTIKDYYNVSTRKNRI